jgi:hypothetical protein
VDGKSLFCIMTYVVMYESKLIWSLGRNEFYKMCVFSVYSVCIQCVFSVGVNCQPIFRHFSGNEKYS